MDEILESLDLEGDEPIVSMVSEDETEYVRGIEKLLGMQLDTKTIEGFEPTKGPVEGGKKRVKARGNSRSNPRGNNNRRPSNKSNQRRSNNNPNRRNNGGSSNSKSEG